MSRCDYCGGVTDTRIGCTSCELKSAERDDLQAEVERLRKVFMHCIENGVMTQDAYEIYDELKAKAEGGEGE